MKKLSSDLLFYRNLVAVIISPFIFVFFINIASANNFSDTVRYTLYALLGIFLLLQWYKIVKTRKILYDKTKLLITPYFLNESKEISINSIIYVKQVFNPSVRTPRLHYKMKYISDDKEYKIYFYRSLNLGSQDDLEVFLGVDNSAHRV